jgi:hypothetical protein
VKYRGGDGDLPSRMVVSVGFAPLLLPRFCLDTLVDFVTARAPLPPATTGLPTPSLVCVSFALRVLVVIAGTGGSESRIGSDSSSSSVSWTIRDPADLSLGLEA